jgi:hypothetical protein
LERYQQALAYYREIRMRDEAYRAEHELACRLLDAWEATEISGDDMRHTLRSAVAPARVASAAASPTLFATLHTERLARGWPDRCTPELPALEVEEMIVSTLKVVAGHEPVLNSWN